MLPHPYAHSPRTIRCLQLLLCLNIGMLLFYLAVDYQLVYHSDAAVKNLLAQEIVETGQYFPREWNYVNGDLWVFFTHTLILPLLAFLPNGYRVAFLSDVFTAGMILHSTWLITGMLQQSRPARLVSVLILAAGMSLIMAEHIYGQAAYGFMYAIACYLLVASWHTCQARGRAIAGWGALTACLLVLVFWANPQRALLYYGLPLAAALALQQLLHWRDAATAAGALSGAGRWRPAGLLLLLAVAMLVGVALNRSTLAMVHAGPGLTQIHWMDASGMLKNFGAVLAGIMGILDGIPSQYGKVASLAGGYAALRLLAALLLMLQLPWALLRAMKAQRGAEQLVVMFTVVAFFTSLFVMVATSLADMSTPDASVRYLVPSLLLMLLILVGVLLDQSGLTALWRWSGIAALGLLASSGPSSLIYPYNEFTHLPMPRLILQTPDQQVANFLRDNGLKYGYATFWNAGKLTVLSNHSVRVRQVQLQRGLPMPDRKLSSNRWYLPESWQGETFLMLRDNELALLDQELLQRLAGPARVLHTQNLTILVFAGNLAKVLPSWDLAARQLARYPMYQGSMHQIGHLDPQQHTLVAEPGEAGTLHFGPMRELEPGQYAVGFDLLAEGTQSDDFGVIDIATEAGTRIHARQTINHAGKQRIVLHLNTEQALSLLEFRVFSSGRGRLTLEGIDILRSNEKKEK